MGATTAEDLPAALGPHGESAVLWNVRAHGRTEVRVRIRRPGGRGFGPPVTLGGSDSVAHIDAAFSPTGRLYAIWGTHDAGQELNRTYNVYAAFVDPGARRASARQALDLGDRVPGILWARVSLVATPSGGAVAGWTGVHTDPAPLPARVAAAGPSGRFGAPQTLDPQAALSDLALSPTDGSVAAT